MQPSFSLSFTEYSQVVMSSQGEVLIYRPVGNFFGPQYGLKWRYIILGLYHPAGDLGQGVQTWLLYELESVGAMSQCVVMACGDCWGRKVRQGQGWVSSAGCLDCLSDASVWLIKCRFLQLSHPWKNLGSGWMGLWTTLILLKVSLLVAGLLDQMTLKGQHRLFYVAFVLVSQGFPQSKGSSVDCRTHGWSCQSALLEVLRDGG